MVDGDLVERRTRRAVDAHGGRAAALHCVSVRNSSAGAAFEEQHARRVRVQRIDLALLERRGAARIEHEHDERRVRELARVLQLGHIARRASAAERRCCGRWRRWRWLYDQPRRFDNAERRLR